MVFFCHGREAASKYGLLKFSVTPEHRKNLQNIQTSEKAHVHFLQIQQ
jgi:hypothetical protein